MSNKSDYELNEKCIAELSSWWHELHHEKASGQARADRAMLKRCASVDEVVLQSAYGRIYRRLLEAHAGEPWKPRQQDRLAALVALLAHVKDKSELSLPKAMSERKTKDDSAPVSELRFQRLLESPDIHALFTGVRRVLPLIKHKVNIQSLAVDVFTWNDRVKKRWAYGYYEPPKTSKD